MDARNKTSEIRKQIIKLAHGNPPSAIRMIDTDLIYPDPFYPLQQIDDNKLCSLARSIRENGFGEPLVLRAMETADRPMFMLINGEICFRACLYGKISPIPCVILDAKPTALPELSEIPFPKNMFEEAEILQDFLKKEFIDESQLAKKLAISKEALQKKLLLLQFDSTERKLILKANLSCEVAVLLQEVSPEAKCDLYRAMANGIRGRTAEDLIIEATTTSKHTKIVIKDIRLFYNTVEKAVATMNRSGISIQYDRKEKKNSTELTITVPKSF